MVYFFIKISDNYLRKLSNLRGGTLCLQEINPGQRFPFLKKIICISLTALWCNLLNSTSQWHKLNRVLASLQTRQGVPVRQVHPLEGLIETDKIFYQLCCATKGRVVKAALLFLFNDVAEQAG